MLIHELAKQIGVPAKTIRYYETIGLLPRPKRAANNYRQYTPPNSERLRFIASARSLGFALADIAETQSVAARDDGLAPCQRVLDAIGRQLAKIDQRIADLLALRESLKQLQTEGAVLTRDDTRTCAGASPIPRPRAAGSRIAGQAPGRLAPASRRVSRLERGASVCAANTAFAI
jgi:MerR family transcriptional regulator, copper efflux regulator